MSDLRSVTSIEADLITARVAVAALEHELRQAQMSGLGIAIGDVVRELRSGDVFIVDDVSSLSGTWCWLKGRKRKRDGTWGTGRFHIGSLNQVERVES